MNGAPGGSSATPAPAASMRFRSACIKVGAVNLFLAVRRETETPGCNDDAREKRAE